MPSLCAATVSVLAGLVLAVSTGAGPAYGVVVADSTTDLRGDTHHEAAYENAPKWMGPLADIRTLTLQRDTQTRQVTAVATMQAMRTRNDPGKESLHYVLEGYDKGLNQVWRSYLSVYNGRTNGDAGSTCGDVGVVLRPATKQVKLTVKASCVTKASTYAVSLDVYSSRDDAYGGGQITVTSDSVIDRFRIY